MSTKYFSDSDAVFDKLKDIEELERLISSVKAKPRVKAVRTGKKDIFEFVPDGATLKKNGYCRSYQILRINEIKKSTADPLKKLSDLVEATACNHDVFFERWPSLSSRLKMYFRFEDGTYSAVVDLILDMAKKDVDNGLERTVEQWYDTILLVLNGMKVAAEKKSQMEAKVNSFEKEIRELNLKLGKAKEVEVQRVKEIDRWYVSYEEAQANAEAQRKKYEKLAEEANNKQKELEKEISQLRSQLEANSKIVSEAKKSIAANRTPIADETLTVLADGVKEYVDEVGVDKAYDHFKILNTILIGVPAWAKHGAALKKFFQKARKEMQNRSMVQGDLVVNKHVDKEVNGVSAGATGILINNNED